MKKPRKVIAGSRRSRTLALQLLSDSAQGLPTRVAYGLLTVAWRYIQVTAALRTQPLAIFTAQRPHWSSQQDLLPQSVFQQQPFSFIIADFGLGLADGKFFPATVDAQGAVDQVKIAVYLVTDRLQTAGTIELQVRRDAADKPNVLNILMMPAMLHHQLGSPLTMEATDLAELLTELNGARLIFLVELQFLEFQLSNLNQHNSTASARRRSTRNSLAKKASPRSPALEKASAEFLN
ncbi:MAG TPA: hypothetical protein VKV05_01455 [Terriglobales bacterium]|nr:hypothetical protein [Terriglobales bacterium]